jgi:hypothetical protein
VIGVLLHGAELVDGERSLALAESPLRVNGVTGGVNIDPGSDGKEDWREEYEKNARGHEVEGALDDDDVGEPSEADAAEESEGLDPGGMIGLRRHVPRVNDPELKVGIAVIRAGCRLGIMQ